mgnify:CR=1 FL=1
MADQNRPHLYKGRDGLVYVGFGQSQSFIQLDRILPQSLRGLSYEQVRSSNAIPQFFDLADMILISAEVMHVHIKAIDMAGASKANPVKTKLPAADWDHLRARDEAGTLLPRAMEALFQVVAAYWEGKHAMAIEPGLVARLWRRGMRAEDIIRILQGYTGADGKLIKASGRGYDIMHVVIEAYLAVQNRPRDAELTQEEMSCLVERWLAATRSASLGSKDAANSVLHWSDYRQLGLVDDAGAAQPEQVRRVARKIFSSDTPLTFEDLSDWVDTDLPNPTSPEPQHASTARAQLRKKRKQGKLKLNRKRGRR